MAYSAKLKKYELLCKTSLKSNEDHDCGVKAIAMVGRVSYKEAVKLCAEHGRKPGEGMYNTQIEIILYQMGFNVQPVTKLYQKNGSKYTPKTIGKRLKVGYYLAYVNGHVLPIINGEIFDWTEGRKHHINSAVKIVRRKS